MAIIGVTHTADGEEIQRLPVTTKVAIGEVVKMQNGKTRPGKLDHFAFLKKSPTTNEWETDPELTKHYGNECRELPVILMSDDPEAVFRTELAWWSTTEKKCWGDGVRATRRTAEHPHGEPWQGCGRDCPERQSGVCKASGDLHFILAAFPKLGSICRIHTTSEISIKNITGALGQMRGMTGGRMTGIKCALTVRPARVTYEQNGVKKTTTAFHLNLEMSAPGIDKLLNNMTQHAQLFQQTRALLTNGRKVEYLVEEEDETLKAAEISEEFPTDAPSAPAPAPAPLQQPQRLPAANGNGNGTPAKVEVMPPANRAGIITKEQRAHFRDVVIEAGWGTQQVTDILLEKWGLKSSADIPTEKYNEVLRYFESGGTTEPEPPQPYQATDEDLPF
jgi:hypothetical protein